MRSVCLGPRRQPQVLDQACCEIGYLRRKIEKRQPRNKVHPSLYGLGISYQNLVEHHLGYVEIKIAAPPLPPVVCDLLAGRDNQVSGWSGREITDHACLDIHRAPHICMLLRLEKPVIPADAN